MNDRIVYVNAVDDLVAASEYRRRSSRGMVYLHSLLKWGGAAVFLLIFLTGKKLSFPIRVLAGVIFMGLFLLFYRILTAGWMARVLAWLYGHSIKGVLGEHTLE